MSISTEDRLVNLMSHWLARHADDARLRAELDDESGLSADQAAAVRELRAALDGGAQRQELEVAVRETLEALAFG
jgi:hypothetical protein